MFNYCIQTDCVHLIDPSGAFEEIHLTTTSNPNNTECFRFNENNPKGIILASFSYHGQNCTDPFIFEMKANNTASTSVCFSAEIPSLCDCDAILNATRETPTTISPAPTHSTSTALVDQTGKRSFLKAMELVNSLQNESMIAEQASRIIRLIAQELNTSFQVNFTARPVDIVVILHAIAAKLKSPEITMQPDSLRTFALAADILAGSKRVEGNDASQQDLSEVMLSLEEIVKGSLNSLEEEKSEMSFTNLFVGRYIGVGKISFPDGEILETHDWSPSMENQIVLTLDPKEGTKKVSFVIFRQRENQIVPDKGILGSPSHDRTMSVASNVVSVTALDVAGEIKVDLVFSVQNPHLNHSVCAFLDASFGNGKHWSDAGCTITAENVTHVTCRCVHLTNFAILFRPGSNRQADPALSWMTKIGVYFSMACLATACLIYFLVWKDVKDCHTILHVNLSACLIVSYIIFVAGSERIESRLLCKFIAILLHYCFLAVFFLMLAEGVHILKTVVFVFNNTSVLKYYISVAYGGPFIIVAVSLIVSGSQGYGDHTTCWLSPDQGLVWAFIGPVILIMAINFTILAIIVVTLMRTRTLRDTSRFVKAKIALRAILILNGILGSSWSMGIFTLINDSIIPQYVFVVLSLLQGVSILCFQCLFNHEVRQGLKKIFCKKNNSIDVAVLGLSSF
ncbi:adhesion G protein-coupled receptor L4-like [Physella acuta]|uniref:adhesion G protein-coupled receptor L4-like n=1 Tax=Physella acuta TaxID=109671 RepID=UPI0027DB127F|nr:adhesion G protein-coupled receptor L4-like [Physella acuta]